MVLVMQPCLTTADMQRTAIVALARASEKRRNATPWQDDSLVIWLQFDFRLVCGTRTEPALKQCRQH